MMFFKKNLPPKTTVENFINIPHVEKVLLWFLQNDKQMQIVNSKAVHSLFDEGMRPKCDKESDPDIFVKKVDDPVGAKPIERWLVLKTWLDLVTIIGEAKEKINNNEGNTPMVEIFERRLNYIEEQTEETLIAAGILASKYSINVNLNFDLEIELSKIKTTDEKEEFKYNYLADALISSEVRLLAWIYKELFNKDYKI